MSKKKHIQEYIKNRFLEINQLQKQVHIYRVNQKVLDLIPGNKKYVT